MTSNSMIRLVSPNLKSEEIVFYWQQNAKVATEENRYIINTIHWVIRDVEELRQDKDLQIAMNKIDLKSYSSVKELSEIFNRKLTNLRKEWIKGNVTPPFINRRAIKEHLRHIIDYCYGRAVDEPDKLNQYVPFSAEVYGETSFELVDQIIEWVKFRPDEIFIDLGSGVGQVVLQVAATTDCKTCCGIEKSDYPSKCALILEQEFRRLMLYFGKPFNQFSLIKGDFLGNEFQDTISSSTVIFANNFAFGPVVDHQLKNIFTSLKEGAKIISSKAFCPLKFRITDRNLDDIGSIMRVTSLRAMENAVSWTCTAFSYYLHQVDHSMLEDYFAKYKQTKVTPEGDDTPCAVRGRPPRQTVRPEAVPMVPACLSQSLDRGLQKALDDGGNQPRLGAGRRASERLLRHCKKRPLRATASSVANGKRAILDTDSEGNEENLAPKVTASSPEVPAAVREYLCVLERRLLAQVGAMRAPAFRSGLLAEITDQLALRDRLSARVTEIEAQIPRLHREGVSLLGRHLARLGIEANSPAGFFCEARQLIKEQARAEADNGRIRREIGDLLATQRGLRDRLRDQEDRLMCQEMIGDRLIVQEMRGDRLIGQEMRGDRLIGQEMRGDRSITQGDLLIDLNAGTHGRLLDRLLGTHRPPVCAPVAMDTANGDGGYAALYSPISRASSPADRGPSPPASCDMAVGVCL